MKIYSHVESNNAGATSVQGGLSKNRKSLEDKGVCYPDDQLCHHGFNFTSQQDEKFWPRQYKDVELNDLQAYVTENLVKIANDFNRGLNTYIFSSEYLFIDDKKSVESILEWFEQHVGSIDLEVILFFRNPVEQYMSSQQKIIKEEHSIESPTFYHYSFRSVIETWSDFCKVNVFEHKKGVDSLQVVSNFLDLDNEGLIVPKRTNESLSVGQMLLLEKTQKNVYSNSAGIFKKHLFTIHNIKADWLTKPYSKCGVSNLIYENHFHDLQWLTHAYEINFDNNNSVGFYNSPFKSECSISDVHESDKKKFESYESMILDLLLIEHSKQS
ncbi:MAG TPA: hypothetical protein DCL21_02780 [Alphaproteobacteria bacterium]|nr:hypothetical protein [Alphaproteobacteria bacterium]